MPFLTSSRSTHEAHALRTATFRYAQLSADQKAAWDDLDASAHDRPCPRGMAAMASLDGDLRVAFAYAGGQLMGAWPLLRVRNGETGVAVRPGGDLQVYDGPTLHGEAAVEAVVHALWAEIQSWWDVDLVPFTSIRAGSPLLSLGSVASAAAAMGRTVRVRLAGLESPTTDLSVQGLRFARLVDEDARWEAMLWVLDVGWPGGEVSDILDPIARDRRMAAWGDALLAVAEDPSAAHMFGLFGDDGDLVAVWLATEDANCLVTIQAFVGTDFLGCGVHGLLTLEVATWAVENGLTELDFHGAMPADVPDIGDVRVQGVLRATVPVRPVLRRHGTGHAA